MPVKKFLKAAEEIQAEVKKKKPKPHAAEEGEGWLVSYADMMTLLCGFFIMMFSMAKMDEPQYERIKEALAKQFGGEYVQPTQELSKTITQVLEEAGLETETTVKTDPGGVSIAFKSTL